MVVPVFLVEVFPAIVMFLSADEANVEVTVFLLGTRGRNTCKAEDTGARSV